MADNKSEEHSYIADKGEVGFIDFADDKSVTSYNPTEEGPVVVSVPFPFIQGKPQSVHVNKVAIDSFTIENTTKEAVDIWGVSIHASNPEDSFILSLMKPPSGQPDDIPKEEFVGSFSLEDRTLRPRDTLTVWLSCEPKEIGVYTSIVHIDIGDERIERVVFLLVEDKVSKALATEKPYRRGRKKNAFTMNSSYITGVRPSNPSKHTYKNRLPVYDIPKEIREVVENAGVPEVIMQGLSRTNYASYFRALLIMEELRIEENMKDYDMECVSMRQRGRNCLTLEVPGLAERRPSLVHGDAVFVRLADDNAEKSYEGCIHRVEADEVFLQFADIFHRMHSDANLYNVRFKYNRVNFRRLYQAIEAAEALHKKFLFPSQYDGMRSITGKPPKPISSLNEEQANAVRLILGCRGGAPYVIHGPPGTGKTKTLVEAILQLYITRRSSRILVCASSNCAADHILEKILCEPVEIKENEIFRLNATSRPFDDINPDFLKFCFFEEDIFKCPSPELLCSYRVIITTYMSASLLYAEGVKRGHFSHIILDEAGQASEPETMIPISSHCHNNTVVVLAGDPMQLGPVIHSKKAEAYGLGRSYLERLFESELYSTEDQNYVTMLVKNYRCHPEILSLPSRLFYKCGLIASREEEDDVSSLPWADLLPNQKFPVLFIGIQGLDEREGSNPSWFNRIEASKVVELIKKLTSRKVKEQDIGVITPYRQQVMKIKKALEGLNKPDIKIGSVEQFQGQEREVIIVSTVRSTVKHNEFDKTFCLGFLSNPKRFNVAMTRARSLLIIVGNPHIIAKDWHWEQMLWHCADNNSYQGCALPVKGQNPDNDGPALNNGDYPTGDQDLPVGNSGPGGDWNEEWNGVNEGDSCRKPAKDEDGWSDGWSSAPLVGDGGPGVEWNGVNEDNSCPKTVKNGDGWSDGWSSAPLVGDSGSGVEWNGVNEDNSCPKPAKDEDGWSDGWSSAPLVGDGGLGVEWNGVNEDNSCPKPVKNEDGWSDGWNSGPLTGNGGPRVEWSGVNEDASYRKPAKDEDGWN